MTMQFATLPVMFGDDAYKNLIVNVSDDPDTDTLP